MSSLTAISPIDGRYANKTSSLRTVASEYGLIRYRVLVEIAWFRFLCAHPDIPECPSLSDDANVTLNKIVDSFDELGAEKVKAAALIVLSTRSVPFELSELSSM